MDEVELKVSTQGCRMLRVRNSKCIAQFILADLQSFMHRETHFCIQNHDCAVTASR
jgi:hypothetical protein